MKKFLLVLLVLLLLGGIGFVAYRTVTYVPEGQLLIVYDTHEDRILYSFGEGWRLVPHNVIFNKVKLITVATAGSVSAEISIDLPDLKDLQDPLYTINYSLTIDYSLDSHEYNPSKSFLQKPEKIIADQLKHYAQSEFTALLSGYVNSGYEPLLISQDWSKLRQNLYTRIEARAKSSAISIQKISETSVLKAPPLDVYEYGILLRNDLLELRKKHVIERENLQHTLNLKALETETYYKSLERISAVIKDNPDILKYMYIEKLGPNITAIVPVGSSGYAFGLDKEKVVEKDVQPGTDIDNLK